MRQDPKHEAWADAAIAELERGSAQAPVDDDTAWADAAIAELAGIEEPTFGGKVLAGAQGFGAGIAGAAKSVFSDLPRSIAVGLGQDPEREMNPWNPAAAIGAGADILREKLTPENPLLSGGAPFRYGETLGQTAPSLLLMAFAPVTGAVAGATQTAGQSGADAIAGGAGALETLAATGMGYLAGGALSGGVAATITNLGSRSGGALQRALMASAAGGGTGIAFTGLTNAIHNWATDDDIPLLQNAAESGAFGALLGGVIGSATEAAMAARRRTGRKMTGQGWTGEMLPEDFQGFEANPEHAAVLEEGARATTEQFESTPEGSQIIGERFRERHATDVGEPEYTPKGDSIAQPFRLRRNLTDPVDPSVGEPIYDEVTGEYRGNREPETAADRAVREQKSPQRTARDIMQAPEEANTTGIREFPEGYTVQGQARSGPRRDVMEPTRTFAEPGMEIPRDESVAYAPTARPDYSKLANPVTDPLTGRTLVTDIGTPTNPSTGLRVTVEDTYKARGVKLRTDVVRSIQDAAQRLSSFVIRTGLVPKGSSGLYDPATREARIAQYGDIVAAAHEAGHAVETAAFGSEFSPNRSPKWKAIEPELARLGKTLYPDSTPHNGHVSEGFAEFQRLWLLQHEDLMRVAPETTAWFDTQFLPNHKEFSASMLAARDSGDQYRFQGSAKRTAVVDPTSWSMRFRKSTLGDLFTGLKTAWFDTAEPLYAMTRAAAEAGAVFEPGTRAVDVFTAKRATADSVVDYFIKHETYNIGRQRTGDSLRDVMRNVRRQGKDFSDYNGMRAALWRNETKTIFDAEQGVRRLAAEPIPFLSVDMGRLADLEARYPHFRGTSDGLLAWYDRVLTYAGEHDPAIANAARLMRQDGEFYMPLNRWADWYESKQKRASSAVKRDASTATVSKRSTGSKREILDPLPSLITQARRIIELSHERAVQNAVIQNALDAHLVGFVSDVTNRVRPLIAADTPFAPGETYGMPLADWADMQVFTQGTIQHADGPIVPYKRARTMPDGTEGFEIRYYQFDPKLHEAVMSMDPNQAVQAIGMLGTTLRFFKNTFVLGAVGLNASFAMLKNPLRDAQSLYVNSRNSPHLASLIPQLMYEHTRVMAHQVSAGLIPYEWVKAYDKLGLDKTDRFATFKSAATTARETTRGGITRYVNLDTPAASVRAFAHVIQASEKATRIWEMKRTASKIGWTPGDYMSPEQAVAMAVDAKQVTVDFNAGGYAAQQINRYVPFFNVMIQAPRSYVRRGIESPGTFALRNAAMMGLGALLWYRYKDEDWMRAMPASERFRYWYVPLESESGEKILGRIPLSQEVAMPVKAFEFFLDAMHSNDPYTTAQYVGAFAQNFIPDMNPIVAEVIEQVTNQRDLDPFNGNAQIVPQRLQGEDASKQVTAYDGRFSVALANILKLPPSRVDHALKNLFAGVGTAAADTSFFGLLSPRTNKPSEAGDTSLVGALARRGGPVSMQSRYVTDLYGLAEVAERNAKVKTDPDSITRRQLATNATRVVSLGYAILETAKLSQVERQKLMSEVNAIAKDAVEQLRGTVGVDPTASIHKRAELQQRANQAKVQGVIPE